MGLPTVISFYCGDRYYHDAAAMLRADCERLSMRHDIEELSVPDDVDWSEICRRKISFYHRKRAEHEGPLLWVDADCRILEPPAMLDGCRFDIAGFAQRFLYIRDFDRYDTVRFWVPGVLLFGDTPVARAFIDHMAEVERGVKERVTDDYVLHEAWMSFERQMNVGFLSPKPSSATSATPISARCSSTTRAATSRAIATRSRSTRAS